MYLKNQKTESNVIFSIYYIAINQRTTQNENMLNNMD